MATLERERIRIREEQQRRHEEAVRARKEKEAAEAARRRAAVEADSSSPSRTFYPLSPQSSPLCTFECLPHAHPMSALYSLLGAL